SQLASKYENLLKTSWGKDDLVRVASEIKRDEPNMRREEVARLRDIYRKQMSAWEQSQSSEVAEAEFEEANS
ncbi:MAG: hypothetical protein EBT21_01665, partial [Actinobacteria bacterium]|nr:hypothetical protein [Actinomycetota bacterium]